MITYQFNLIECTKQMKGCYIITIRYNCWNFSASDDVSKIIFVYYLIPATMIRYHIILDSSVDSVELKVAFLKTAVSVTLPRPSALKW